ncbi:hypothetical protein ACHAWO_001896 [Cyclotella atomus]|uniref:Uncharacterized protein n=1 Tax=Cyclotella atomus TaxID=382360 RepID=A0ABD3NI25_9STRA
MKLYDSNKGSYLEGILLVESFIPMVGTTTILQDSNGDVILVALYNFLPDGLHGEESVPIASMKIPKGGRTKIAAPCMKVFRDGSRGIRIDNPSDIQLLTENVDDNNDEVSAPLQAKKLGNDLVAKKMYDAASDAYIGGLRKAIMVPTLLSNRSQAHAMLEEWEHSMADAEASLVIRPCNKKTWARYKKAIDALKKSESGEISERVRTGAIVMRVLLSESDGTDQSSDKESKDALELKNEGNKAFQTKHFADAVKYYSASLNACGEETRALLSNWSLC